MSKRTTGRGPAVKHFWMKWEFARWLNEPTLITAGNAVQGFWFNLLNRMGVAQSPTLDDTPEGYALLGLCREHEVASRLHALRMLGIADVEENGGRVRVTCRSMVRQMEISARRREAAQERWKRKKTADLEGSAAAEVGIPENKPVEPLQGILHVDLHMQNPMQSSNSGFNSSSLQDEELQEEKAAPPPPPPPAPEDIQPLVTQIVLAHPKARMRGWKPVHVGRTEREAATNAVELEALDRKCSRTDAALFVLGRVEALARNTPQERWQFLKDIPASFRAREYGIDAIHLQNGGNDGKPARDSGFGVTRPSPVLERRDRNRQGLWEAAKFFAAQTSDGFDGQDTGPVPAPGAAPGDEPDVHGGVPGAGDTLRGKPPGRVVEGFVSRSSETELLSHTG
jgi:hypothetical protein